MSIYLSFTKFQILRKDLTKQPCERTFIFSIYNEKFKEGMKFTTSITNEKMQACEKLANNVLVLPDYEKIRIKVQESGSEMKQKLEGKRILIEKEVSISKRQKVKEDNGIFFKEKFELQEGEWNFIFHYQFKEEERLRFVDHFNKVLSLQIEQKEGKSSKIMPKIFHINENPSSKIIKQRLSFQDHEINEHECQKQTLQIHKPRDSLTIKSMPKSESSGKSKPDSLSTNSNSIKEQNNGMRVGEHRFLKTTNSTWNGPQETILTQINEEPQEFFSTSIKNVEKSEKKLKLYTPMRFYKGPCKSKNFFSCCDCSVKEEEICLVQPYYK